MAPDIFEYLDYRQYLIDAVEARRKEDADFSYRAFARLAGHTSPNYLQLIRDHKLGVQEGVVPLLAAGLGLRKREAAYFATLVAFDHARNHAEKDKAFHAILASRQYRSVKTLTREQYEYFSHWYMPVVRELAVHPRFYGNPDWIARRIVPAISPAKVTRALAMLEKLGLIRRAGASWVQSDRAVSTPAEVLSVAVVKYHHDMIALGQQAIERFKSADRDIRGITLGLSPEGYVEVKKRMQAFWKELLAFAETQDSVDTVYQLNTQLFPVSRKDRGRK